MSTIIDDGKTVLMLFRAGIRAGRLIKKAGPKQNREELVCQAMIAVVTAWLEEKTERWEPSPTAVHDSEEPEEFAKLAREWSWDLLSASKACGCGACWLCQS